MDPLSLVMVGGAIAFILAAGWLGTRMDEDAAPAPSPPSVEQEVDDSVLTGELRGLLGRLPPGIDIAVRAYVGPRGSGRRIVLTGLRADLSLESGPGSPRYELQVGDETFDGAFFVAGRIPEVNAVLGADARRSLLGLARGLPAGGALHMSSGVLVIDVPDPAATSMVLAPHAAAAVRLLPLLRPSTAPPLPGLIANARRDPAPGVRRRCVELLASEFAGDGDALRAVSEAMQDGDPEVRLAAARARGSAAARATLLALATDRTVSDSCAGTAVDTLRQIGPAEARLAVAATGFRGRPFTARACADALGRGGGPDAIPVLESILDQYTGAAALAAVAALAHIGTAAAVAPLRTAAESHRDEDVQRAAARALGDVKAGLVGAEQGQVSIAGGQEGQVTVVDDAGGRLSVAQKRSGPTG